MIEDPVAGCGVQADTRANKNDDGSDDDDDNGGRLDETILVGLIANSPSCLKHKPLQWFLDTYLITEEEWKKIK